MMQSTIVKLMYAPMNGWIAISGRSSRPSCIVGLKF